MFRLRVDRDAGRRSEQRLRDFTRMTALHRQQSPTMRVEQFQQPSALGPTAGSSSRGLRSRSCGRFELARSYASPRTNQAWMHQICQNRRELTATKRRGLDHGIPNHDTIDHDTINHEARPDPRGHADQGEPSCVELRDSQSFACEARVVPKPSTDRRCSRATSARGGVGRCRRGCITSGCPRGSPPRGPGRRVSPSRRRTSCRSRCA